MTSVTDIITQSFRLKHSSVYTNVEKRNDGLKLCWLQLDEKARFNKHTSRQVGTVLDAVISFSYNFDKVNILFFC